MAVYTDVSADDLADFLSEYDLGELLSYKGIAEGVENSNFLVHTTKGYCFLTLYEKRVAPEDLPFFLGLMEHLAARGLTCPQPVKNRTGGMIGSARGPSRRDRDLSRRHVDSPAERRPLRGGRRGACEAASGGSGLFHDAGATRSRSTDGGRCVWRRPRAPTACSRDCARRSSAS